MTNSTTEASNGLKEHEIKELLNELRDIAVVYHATEQLRIRIAYAVLYALQHPSYPRKL